MILRILNDKKPNKKSKLRLNKRARIANLNSYLESLKEKVHVKRKNQTKGLSELMAVHLKASLIKFVETAPAYHTDNDSTIQRNVLR